MMADLNRGCAHMVRSAFLFLARPAATRLERERKCERERTRKRKSARRSRTQPTTHTLPQTTFFIFSSPGQYVCSSRRRRRPRPHPPRQTHTASRHPVSTHPLLYPLRPFRLSFIVQPLRYLLQKFSRYSNSTSPPLS